MSRNDVPHVVVVIDAGVAPEDKAVARRRWLEIAPALIARDVRLTVATLQRESGLHEQLRDLGCGALSLSNSHERSVVRSIGRLARTIHRDPPSLIHGHEALPTLIGSSAALLTGLRARIYHRYHVVSSGRHVALSRLAAKLSTHTIAVSAAAAGAAHLDDKTRTDQISIAFNGAADLRRISSSRVLALRSQLGIDQAERVVLCVSRLRREKGIDVLIDAVKYVENSSPVAVVIVGSGSELHDLQARAREKGARIVFAGHRDDVNSFYSLADVVAIPSRMDALPFSAVEAMSAGLPVVATRVGGLPEVVEENVTGLLVSSEQPVELGGAIARLLESPERAAKLGLSGRLRYEKFFSLSAMVDGWFDAYDSLLRT